MLFIRSFVNLIMVPAVAFYILYVRSGFEIRFSFKALVHYFIITACNIPFTRAFTFVLRIITGKSIEADDSYYTIAALVAAVLLPYIYEFYCKVKKKAELEKKAGI